MVKLTVTARYTVYVNSSQSLYFVYTQLSEFRNGDVCVGIALYGNHLFLALTTAYLGKGKKGTWKEVRL